jgi:hypothetical protein
MGARTNAVGGFSTDFECAGGLIPAVANCLQERDAKGADSDTKPGHLIPVYGFGGDVAPVQKNQLTRQPESCILQGINKGGYHASAQERDAVETLRALRDEVGEEAFAEWRSGILDSLQSPEVLRQALHGVSIRRAARESGMCLDDRTLARPKNLPTGAMLELWKDGPDGRSPQGRELAQQLARESGASLPLVSHNEASSMQVRRLTPRECSRLQGFPDGHTAAFSDCTRYRMMGNAVCVNVSEWIARRLAKHTTKGGKYGQGE